MTRQPRIIIIGAGFGGLYAARTLAGKPVDVLLIDRNNFHTFTPLLYQVATCGLDPSEIAYPVRSIFRKTGNIRFLLGEVTGIDFDLRQITVRTNGQTRQESYDYLIVAAGSVTNYYGDQQLEQNAFGLKSLRDAVDLRNHILRAFEKAAWTDDPAYCEALSTLVVVGGGPTGLETAGALYELYNFVLKHEFSAAHHLQARVILVEAANHLLAPYPERLRESAFKQLESLGVEVILGDSVDSVADDHITLSSGRVLPTCTLVWSAGVKGAPIVDILDVPLQRGGRVPIEPTLEIIGRERVYAVGDIAYLEDAKKQPYPMLIPVAKQQGILAAKNILNHIEGNQPAAFHYSDRGIMATIGRSRAVAWIFYRVQLTGHLAWLAWLFLHLVTLLGFRNRASVFLSWVWNYLTFDRSVRIILDRSPFDGKTESEPTDTE
jgi:NADH dehydrogenase